MRLLVFIAFAFILFSCDDRRSKDKVPFIGNYDLEYSTVNGEQQIDTIYQPIEKFSFLNQDSTLVTEQTYDGEILITEFFFATCPTICPIMNVQMSKLHEAVKSINGNQNIQFLSFSIDPIKDTPSALNKYKKSLCIDCENWDFLTGDEAFTHRLGIESFKVFAGREEEAEGGYAHSGAFSMVDQNGYLRGVYNITGFDGSVNKMEYQRLLRDLQILIESEIVTN